MATRSRGYEIGLMVLLSLAFGFVFFDRNSMSFLAPFVAPDLRLSNTQVAMLSAGFSFAWAIAGYLGGAMSDATGRRCAPFSRAWRLRSRFCWPRAS
jgi:MFS transporter, ACS family, hexuronate transporter